MAPTFYVGGGGDAETPAPTAQERQLAKIGAEQWNDYATRYAGPGGVNEKFIEATRATEADKGAAGAIVGADAAVAGKQIREATSRQGLARGASSASGAAVSAAAGDATDLASTTGRAKGLAVQSVEDAQLQADFKLASFGRGLASDAQVGLQGGVSRATSLVNEAARAKFLEKQSLMAGVGTGVGMLTQGGGKKTPEIAPGQTFEVNPRFAGR